MSKERFAGKVALVTGAGRAETVAIAIRDQGGQALVYAADVTDETQVEAMV